MIDTAWHFINAGQGDQLKRRKGQEIEFYKAGHLVIAKVAKTILWTGVLGELGAIRYPYIF